MDIQVAQGRSVKAVEAFVAEVVEPADEWTTRAVEPATTGVDEDGWSYAEWSVSRLGTGGTVRVTHEGIGYRVDARIRGGEKIRIKASEWFTRRVHGQRDAASVLLGTLARFDATRISRGDVAWEAGQR